MEEGPVNVPSTPWQIVGLIVLAIVAVYLFVNIILPLIQEIA